MISPCGIRLPQLQNAAETAVTQKTEPGVFSGGHVHASAGRQQSVSPCVGEWLASLQDDGSHSKPTFRDPCFSQPQTVAAHGGLDYCVYHEAIVA